MGLRMVPTHLAVVVGAQLCGRHVERRRVAGGEQPAQHTRAVGADGADAQQRQPVQLWLPIRGQAMIQDIGFQDLIINFEGFNY